MYKEHSIFPRERKKIFLVQLKPAALKTKSTEASGYLLFASLSVESFPLLDVIRAKQNDCPPLTDAIKASIESMMHFSFLFYNYKYST